MLVMPEARGAWDAEVCVHGVVAGNILIAGSKDCTVWMWLASTGDCMKVRPVVRSSQAAWMYSLA